MGDCNHLTRERASSVGDDITVALHALDSHSTNSEHECGDDERAAERIHLQTYRRVSGSHEEDENAEESEEAGGSDTSPQGSEEAKTLCLPACCVRGKPASRRESAHEGSVWLTVSQLRFQLRG